MRRRDRRSPSRALLTVALATIGAMVLVGCGGGSPQPSSVVWRNIEIPVPDGWYVVEQEDDRLSIANVDLAEAAEQGEAPPGDTVAMFFTYEPATAPDDWRDHLRRREADLEVDDRLVLEGEVPATRLIYRDVSLDVPTREMVALIPSRAVVVLAQPIPRQGQQDAPELFMEHVGTFVEVLEGARFGRPLVEEG